MGGKRLTSANIKKDIQTFCVWCSRRDGEEAAREGDVVRQETMGTSPPCQGGRGEGLWALGPGAPGGRGQPGSHHCPYVGLTGQGSERRSGAHLAPQEVPQVQL